MYNLLANSKGVIKTIKLIVIVRQKLFKEVIIKNNDSTIVKTIFN